MVTYKTIRRNKQFLKDPKNIINPYRNNSGNQTPLQDKIIGVVIINPNCTMNDIYKELKKQELTTDTATIRKAIRKMIESHKIRQRFTVESI